MTCMRAMLSSCIQNNNEIVFIGQMAALRESPIQPMVTSDTISDSHLVLSLGKIVDTVNRGRLSDTNKTYMHLKSYGVYSQSVDARTRFLNPHLRDRPFGEEYFIEENPTAILVFHNNSSTLAQAGRANAVNALINRTANADRLLQTHVAVNNTEQREYGMVLQKWERHTNPRYPNQTKATKDMKTA